MFLNIFADSFTTKIPRSHTASGCFFISPRAVSGLFGLFLLRLFPRNDAALGNVADMLFVAVENLYPAVAGILEIDGVTDVEATADGIFRARSSADVDVGVRRVGDVA